jgi:hypothetical protein
VHKIIISADKRVEFVSYRLSYTILRGRWYLISVLNVSAPKDGYCEVQPLRGTEKEMTYVAALEDLDCKAEINSAWEMSRNNISIPAKRSLGNYQFKRQVGGHVARRGEKRTPLI